MKLHAIIIHNLHSLTAPTPVTIAFNQAPLRDCSLFAITGPTGAGKTTILDALTLALYGEIARPGNERDVMSHGAATCSAEVIFETPAGCFKARWGLRRARGKANGTLQPTERELAEYPSGKILADKINDVDALIQETIGLNKEQFLKSVLLAQGKFMEFLQARDGERATLLERLTGTSLYRKLSSACYEQQKAHLQQLEALQRDTDNLVVLTTEEKALLEQQRQEFTEQSILLAETLTVLDAELHWHQRADALNQQRTTAERALEDSQDQQRAAAVLYQRWEQHQAVLPLEVSLYQWKQTRQERLTIETALEQARIACRETQTQLDAQDLLLQQVQDVWQRCKTELTTATPVLQEAIRTEGLIAEKKARRQQETERLSQLSGSLVALRQELVHSQTSVETQAAAIDQLNAWFETHQKDRNLAKILESLAPQSLRLAAYRERRNALKKQIETALSQRQQLKESRIEIQERQEELLKIEAAIETRLQDITRHQQTQKKAFLELQEAQTLRRQTQQATLDKLHRAVEALRFFITHHQKLTPGQPCDLCGSTLHPNVAQDLTAIENDLAEQQQELDHTVIQKQETDRLLTQTYAVLALLSDSTCGLETAVVSPESPELIQSLQAEQQRLLATLPLTQENRLQTIWQLQQADEALEQWSRDLITLESDDQEVRNEEAALELHFQQVADAYELTFPEQDELAFIDQLRSRLAVFRNQEATLEKLHVQHQNQTAVQAGQLKELLVQTTEQAERQIGLNALSESIEALETALKKAYPAAFTSALSYQHHLDEQFSTADHQLREGQQHRTQLAQQALLSQQRRNDLEYQLEQLLSDLQQLEQTLAVGLREKSLPDDFEAATQLLLPVTERQTIEASIRTLEQQLAQAQAIHRQVQQEWETHFQLALSVQPFMVIQQQREALRNTYDELQQAIGQSSQILNEDQDKTTQRSDRIAAVQAQTAVVQRWQTLNDLIGSANGDRFANFAQTLSLDHLLIHANLHLRHLSDRYRLRRKTDGKETLGIQVEDRYLAGMMREIGSLSGGETFLVSLGLALGLADMASEHTPIESLFIDEGFGSLDADALEDALQALENLQARGKTIGIISHVEQLKERISTQIVVQKIGDGVSRIDIVG